MHMCTSNLDEDNNLLHMQSLLRAPINQNIAEDLTREET